MTAPAFAPVGDPAIRDVLHSHIASAHPGALILDEVATGVSRMDVVALGETLVGFEIKSWRDSLARLEQQVYDYAQVCDFCCAVATMRHMDAIEARVPEWWGLLLVEQDGDAVDLFPLREMAGNPSIDVKRCAHLLWRDELLALIAEHGVHARVSSKPRAAIADALHASVPLAPLRASILRTLRERDRTTPSPFGALRAAPVSPEVALRWESDERGVRGADGVLEHTGSIVAISEG
jgi:hypothetical protein